jgi:hypothetical protein
MCLVLLVCSVGYQTKACTDSLIGTSDRYLGYQVVKVADLYQNKLLQEVEELCKGRVKCLHLSTVFHTEINASVRNKAIPILFGSPHTLIFVSE